MTHVLTDNGSCFTPAFARTCAELGAQYRHTKPRSPQTNGMVERFNGRIGSEVLAITIYSHHQLEQLLRGFNAAYNARRQRVLEAKTPDQIVAERLTAKPALAKNKPAGRAGPCDITKARLIAENAKEVSQPDIGWHFLDCPHGCAVARSAGGVWQLELDLAAIPALERQWRVGCSVASAGRQRRRGGPVADD